MQEYESLVDWLYIILIIVSSIIGGAYVKYRRRHRKISNAGTSVLLAYYTDGVELFPVKSGKFGDIHYSTIAAAPLRKGEIGETALIYQVNLPFKSIVHLVGIPKKNRATQLFPAGGNSSMEKVVLEGDYNDYFTLYAEKDMQQESRYVLDPKAMVFTIDFCRSHNWEIVGNQLYFVQATANDPDDPTSMEEDITDFINEIRPAVAVPLSDAEIQKITPYDKEYRTDLKCPICHSIFENKDTYLSCPNGDGILIKGAALMKLRDGQLKISGFENPSSTKRTNKLVCPSCGNEMQEVAYNATTTIIDTCSHCPYRWLDAGELSLNKPR